MNNQLQLRNYIYVNRTRYKWFIKSRGLICHFCVFCCKDYQNCLNNFLLSFFYTCTISIGITENKIFLIQTILSFVIWLVDWLIYFFMFINLRKKGSLSTQSKITSFYQVACVVRLEKCNSLLLSLAYLWCTCNSRFFFVRCYSMCWRCR